MHERYLSSSCVGEAPYHTLCAPFQFCGGHIGLRSSTQCSRRSHCTGTSQWQNLTDGFSSPAVRLLSKS
ncbi:hypothetical protein N656DRAFT_311882 [Canariomyces notabilis]|uniref:Uncharacterized protein n=1 Tax=Canariomyces notabilis TaxID=2074819 RepID=A0AAN6QGS7_9PEZI|nr:hypothetical protein N656DRAFT_311882 [Canariomyces arenarius]